MAAVFDDVIGPCSVRVINGVVCAQVTAVVDDIIAARRAGLVSGGICRDRRQVVLHPGLPRWHAIL